MNSDGKLSLKAPRRIVLKKTVEGGSIKQNFSHGRSKSVVVEVRRKRTFIKAGSDAPAEDLTSHAARTSSSAGASHDVAPDGTPATREAKGKEQHILLPMTQEERHAFEQETREREEREQATQSRQEVDPSTIEQEITQPANELETPPPIAQAIADSVASEELPSPTAPAGEIAAAPQRVEHQPQPAGEWRKVGTEAQAGRPPAGPQKGELSRSELSGGGGVVASGPRSSPQATTPHPSAAAHTGSKGAGGDTERRSSGQPAREKRPADGPRPAATADGASGGAKSGRAPDRDRDRDRGKKRERGPRVGPGGVAELLLDEDPMPGLDGAATPEDDATPELIVGLAVDAELDKGDGKRKLTRLQREEVARKKTEDLVTKRLSQLEELREQKRRIEEQRTLEVEGQRLTQNRETLKTKGKRKGRKGAGSANADGSGDGQGGGGMPIQGRSSRGGRDERRNEGPPAPVVREVVVPETITVAELANRMAVKSSKVIKLLFSQGMMVTINQVLDQDTATLVVEEMGHRTKQVSVGADIEAELADAGDHPETLVERWPVVTVMGHVDHGKTSLLDAIRKTNVTAGEHGGITQHIGAYQVTTASGKRITFLDTPGHAAFTAMRARGARATDIVVLVVAADDGVMPQTIEAVSHAKDAGVPIVVAVNKIDKPNANPDRVMQQLSERGLVPEAWGGETIFVPLSAKMGTGVEGLEEMILLQAEMLGLKANPDRRARGVIIEANLDRGRGAVATCLVRNGTLRVGDVFVVGHEWGKIRGLLTDQGESVPEAGPSTPVEVIGLSGIPKAGDNLVVVPDERRAREIAAFRAQKSKEQEQARQSPAKLDELFDQIKEGEKADLKVVIKGDVQGSVEALSDALRKIEHPRVQVTVIHMGVGGINESDVMLAVASDAVVVGFNVRADAKARDLAKREKVDLRFYNVIYDLVDDVKRAMEGMLESTFRENVIGHAAVRELFRISKVGTVAGCLVADGLVQRNALVRLLRDNIVVYEGSISALKRFKEDAREVREGVECGISLDKFSDIKVGDVIEAYVREEVRPTLSE
ncbi:MAG: translation initiation factor IF-2 [Magnetococcales bacterium]|nr:translation initiation factor IF-2 [Magnetococcales bacterium]